MIGTNATRAPGRGRVSVAAVPPWVAVAVAVPAPSPLADAPPPEPPADPPGASAAPSVPFDRPASRRADSSSR